MVPCASSEIACVMVNPAPGPWADSVAALSAVLGGLVLLGSNATTWEQTAAALHAAEAARAQLIGSIDLRLVGEERPTMH